MGLVIGKGIGIGFGSAGRWSSYWNTRNEDEVEIANYRPLATTSNINVEQSTGSGFLNKNNLSKVRQNGTITKIQFYVGTDVAFSYCYFQVWRYDGANYNLVGERDITDLVTPLSTNTITLPSPISVNEGDMCAIWTKLASAATGTLQELAAVTSLAAGSSRWKSPLDKPSTGHTWDAETSATFMISLKAFGQAPGIVAIGDSIIAAHPAHYSCCENSLVWSPSSSIAGQLIALRPTLVIQNMGIGSQTTTQIAARFTADVVNLKPKYAIIQGGVNDISGGVITKATFLANYTAMLNVCSNTSIKPVVLKIIPWTDGDNTELASRDEWMTDLAALVATYTGAKFIDFDSILGEFRVGGAANNLWNIKAAYNADGVHLNASGYAAMAVKIDEEMRKR
jgi:lysophospholipase L1-like esterase